MAAQLTAAPGRRSDLLVYFADQVDLAPAAALSDWQSRGAAVVTALQDHAKAGQAPLMSALLRAGHHPRPYWIVNAIAVEGDLNLARWLAAQPGVALVTGNPIHTLDLEEAVSTSVAQGAAWGLEQIQAPSVWADWGVRGAGIVIANLDTGVYMTHTALISRYRGWSPTDVVHDYNWYDAAGEPALPVPSDTAGHGTHTMGTIVGGAAAGFDAVGVAPDARWIAVRGCLGLFCSDEALIAGAQWLLAPTDLAGNAPRPDLRPHIINNSWGKSSEDDWYQGYVTAWNAAGIFSIFAAGNTGALNGCGSTNSPGSYAASFAVGATDMQDAIADFSSRGPTSTGLLKPDLSAPGVAVPSAWPDGDVRTQSGTSMAAPHVAGVVALLWSANPILIGDLPATRAALTSSALPVPTAECGPGGLTVPNNVYGWGRLDARSAVEAVRVDVPWLSIPAGVSLPANGSKEVEVLLDARRVAAPGTYAARLLVARSGGLTPIAIAFEVLPADDTAPLSGTLTDVWQAQPVYGRVLIGDGLQVDTDLSGHFSATLPFATYALTATATGHFSAATGIVLTGPLTANLVLLPDLPHLVAAAPAISATLAFAERQTMPFTVTNVGTQPLSLTASVRPLEWVGDVSGEPGAALYDLSAFVPLSLTDDMIYPEPLALGFDLPVNGALINQIYVSSNGWVSGALPGSAAPFPSCLPSGSLPPLTLAPFWADLDPSQGGTVRAGSVSPGTFVASFEGVPLWQQAPTPNPPTYTFQLALYATGHVEFRYGGMAAPPARWAVGFAHDQQRGYGVACYKTPQELSSRLWSLHNQPLATLWLDIAPGSQWVAPGATAVLTATLNGFGHVPWHPGPFLGPSVLTTNDPAQRTVTITATAQIGPAPYSMYFPEVRHK